MMIEQNVSCARRKFLILIARLGLALGVDLFEELVQEKSDVPLAFPKRRQIQDGDS